jgi:AcrR family transcriptional regulator
MAAVAPLPSRGRPRDPKRDAAIFEAALSLVAEVGYDRMTVDAVAARAGVSKPTIYRRCPEGKAQIVAQAILRRRDARPVLEDRGSLREDLLAIVTEMCRKMADETQLAAGLTSQLRHSEELAAIFREHVIAAERARWAAIAERAAARGELPEGDVTPLFSDVGPALIHARSVIAAEPLDGAFVVELVDRVLLPILNPDLRRTHS